MKHFRFPMLALLVLLTAMLACGESPAKESALPKVQRTLRPTFTPTRLPQTDTPLPPTATPLPPTDTPLPPTATLLPPTETPLPTATPVPPTETPLPPTAKPRPTNTPLPPTATPILILLSDNFDGGLGGGWKSFTNYWRVEDWQWYWGANEGVGGSGAVGHNCCAGGGQAEDALMMYLGEGAEGWTDYRVKVQFLVPTAEKGQWPGLWVRGQYEERTKKDTAQWVTGYYIMLGRTRTVKLLQLQTTEDCQGNACRNPQNLYAFNNPYILREEKVEGLEMTRGLWHALTVEARGNRIKIWVDGVFAFEYVDDKSPFLQGTVGFKTFEVKPVLYDNLVVTPLD